MNFFEFILLRGWTLFAFCEKSPELYGCTARNKEVVASDIARAQRVCKQTLIRMTH